MHSDTRKALIIVAQILSALIIHTFTTKQPSDALCIAVYECQTKLTKLLTKDS